MAEYDTTFDKPFIGYDGSQAAHFLLDIFKDMHSKFQKTVIVHVADPIKNFIPPGSRGPAIEQQMKQKLEGLKNIDIKVANKAKDETKSTNEIILNEVFLSKSSFMFLGFYGQKGRKPRETELCSRIRRFVYDSKNAVAIIKKPSNQTKSVIFCFDGSEISQEGLKKAVAFSKKFDQNLTILHVYSSATKNYSKQVKNYLKNVQVEYKNINIDVIVEEGSLKESLCEKCCKYDWIIMNRNGYRGEISNKIYVGSKTTEVLTEIESNLIILN